MADQPGVGTCTEPSSKSTSSPGPGPASDLDEAWSDIVLYDGECRLCSGLVHFLAGHDRDARFHLVALSSKDGESLLEKHALPTDRLDTFVYVQDGKAYIKSTAALRLFRRLGGAWRLLFVLMIVPRSIRDLVYDLIARYRHVLSGSEQACTRCNIDRPRGLHDHGE